jgi:hypothetical protein
MRDYDEDGNLLDTVGHAGPYFPYDPADPRAPVKEKDPPGFVRTGEYVKAGVVKKYKSGRKKAR